MAHSLATSITSSEENYMLNSFYNLPDWASDMLHLLARGGILCDPDKQVKLLVKPIHTYTIHTSFSCNFHVITRQSHTDVFKKLNFPSTQDLM